jgi:hypothetical protein
MTDASPAAGPVERHPAAKPTRINDETRHRDRLLVMRTLQIVVVDISLHLDCASGSEKTPAIGRESARPH